jgi:hypothetical protein
MPIPLDTMVNLRRLTAIEIAGGFKSPEEILQYLCDLFEDDDGIEPQELRQALPPILETLSAEHEAAKRFWPIRTDCDRLDDAFDELNRRGIMARHDWTCCGTCGHAAMPAEYDRCMALDPSLIIRGYAFYHNQDTESAADQGGLYLAYGATDDIDDDDLLDQTTLAIGREIVEVLNGCGLEVQWDESTETRILIDMKWQRRFKPARWCENLSQ